MVVRRVQKVEGKHLARVFQNILRLHKVDADTIFILMDQGSNEFGNTRSQKWSFKKKTGLLRRHKGVLAFETVAVRLTKLKENRTIADICRFDP